MAGVHSSPIKWRNKYGVSDREADFIIAHPDLGVLALEVKGGGFYLQPSDIQVILFLPTPDSSPAISDIDWQRVTKEANDCLEKFLPDVEAPFSVIKYSLDGDPSMAIQEFRMVLERCLNLRTLCLMVTPGPQARFSQSPEVKDAEKQSYQLNRRLRGLIKIGYTATVGWDNPRETLEIEYVINNVLIRALYRLGAVPWVLIDLPFQAKQADSVYFLGLFGHAESRQAAGTLFDYQGNLVAFGGIYPDKSGVVT